MTYKPSIVLAFFKSEGLPKVELEYKFHPVRKWRFDFAFPQHGKVYLEVDGGIWIVGGHNRGAGILKDWEKRNAASALGWRGLWVQPKDLCTVATVEMIKACLKTQERICDKCGATLSEVEKRAWLNTDSAFCQACNL